MIRSSPVYPCSGNVSSVSGGRVELSPGGSLAIRSVLVLVGVCKSDFSDLRFSSLVMVIALVRWSFRP
jgi:hypothetical protein